MHPSNIRFRIQCMSSWYRLLSSRGNSWKDYKQDIFRSKDSSPERSTNTNYSRCRKYQRRRCSNSKHSPRSILSKPHCFQSYSMGKANQLKLCMIHSRGRILKRMKYRPLPTLAILGLNRALSCFDEFANLSELKGYDRGNRFFCIPQQCPTVFNGGRLLSYLCSQLSIVLSL